MKQPRFRSALFTAAACYAAASLVTVAEADPPATPPPIPTPPPMTLNVPPRVQPVRVATVTLEDQSVVVTRAAAAKFQIVAARPGETATMVVPMPVTAFAASASVQALDGGALIGPPSSPVTPNRPLDVPIVNRNVTFQFQVGTHPGLYRVLIMGLGPAAALQFWVQDPLRPATNPWAVNASHWQPQ